MGTAAEGRTESGKAGPSYTAHTSAPGGPEGANAPEEPTPPPKWSWRSVVALLTGALKSVGSLMGIVFSLLIAIYVVRLTISAPIMLEPLAIPKSLADQGVESDQVLHAIASEVERIGQSFSQQQRRKKALPTGDVPDISISEAKISLRTFAGFLRQAVTRKQPPRLLLSLLDAAEGGTDYRLTVRLEGHQADTVSFKRADLDEAIKRAAERVVGQIQPVLFAAYLLNGDEPDAGLAKQWAQYALASAQREDDASAYLVLGQIALAENDIETASRRFDAAVALQKDLALGYLGLAEVAAARSSSTELDLYRTAVKHDHKLAAAWAGIGDIYYWRGQSDSARANYQRAIDSDNSYPGGYIGLGWILGDEHHPGRKIKLFDEALAREPRNQGATDGIANWRMERGEYRQAYEAAKNTRDLDSSWSVPWTLLGRIEDRFGDSRARATLDNALTLAQTALAQRQSDANRLMAVADIFRARHELDSAVQYATNAIRLERSNVVWRLDLASMLVEAARKADLPAKESDSLFSLADSTLRVAGNNPGRISRFFQVSGDVALGLRDTARARESFREAFALDSSNNLALLGLIATRDSTASLALSRFHDRIECVSLTRAPTERDSTNASPDDACWSPDISGLQSFAIALDSLRLTDAGAADVFDALIAYMQWNSEDPWPHARLAERYARFPSQGIDRETNLQFADIEFYKADSLGLHDRWMYDDWRTVRTMRHDTKGAEAILACERSLFGRDVSARTNPQISELGSASPTSKPVGIAPYHCGQGIPWQKPPGKKR